MIAKTTTLLGLALVVSAASPLVSAGRGGTPPAPVVTSASGARATHQLVIRGYAFGPDAPSVFLGEQRLQIKQNKETEIIAHLPADLPAAAYRLVVVRNNNLQSQPFSIQVLED